MDFKKFNFKKIGLIILIVLLAGYVLRDVGLRLAGNLRMQGYQIAVEEMIEQANNEECAPFNIYSGDEEVNIIKVDCLKEQSASPANTMPEEEPAE